MASVWSETAAMPPFPSLNGDKQTDVLIIGGGIAGILCAYELRKAGVSSILLEAKELCSGITQNTTAKITSQHGFLYHKLLKRFGAEKAQTYYRENEKAVKAYKALCQGIDCDFEVSDSYVYSLDDRSVLEAELNALYTVGAKGDLVEKLPLPVETAGAVRFRNQVQFHPLKFLAALTEGLEIYTHSPVREVAPGCAVTDFGKVQAEKMVITTHFPMLNKHGSYFLKLYQSRSYVLALENVAKYPGMYLDGSGFGLSFRNYGSLLLLGGGSHRTGKDSCGWDTLERFAARHYPNGVIRYRWAAQDCMSLDGIPYIGQYSKNTPDLYVATGFNKWGMTSSMVAARRLTRLLKGEEDPLEEIFSPSRCMLHPQLGINAFEAARNILSFKTRRCPHLGCALRWNPQEHSWDCPCHGSRFQADGKLIDGPATGDAKWSK